MRVNGIAEKTQALYILRGKDALELSLTPTLPLTQRLTRTNK